MSCKEQGHHDAAGQNYNGVMKSLVSGLSFSCSEVNVLWLLEAKRKLFDVVSVLFTRNGQWCTITVQRRRHICNQNIAEICRKVFGRI